jgi:hypothetical protein
MPQRKRNGGLLITAIVLGLTLLLAGGGLGAYHVFGTTEGDGVVSPERAVDGFLTAMFKDGDVEAASSFVCASSRDSKALKKRVGELASFEASLKSPTYSWPAPKVASRTEKSAEVNVRIKVTTSDDKVSEQPLKILTVQSDGWLVCEITPAT